MKKTAAVFFVSRLGLLGLRCIGASPTKVSGCGGICQGRQASSAQHS